MFTVFLLLVAAAAAALALPTGQLDARATSPWCSGLGPGAFDSAENFTLAAYNTTLPNANATGAPLVLGQAGAVDGAEFEVLSVRGHPCYAEFIQLMTGTRRGPPIRTTTGRPSRFLRAR